MKVTEVRLTLAAYIYAIEDDLRDIIRNYIIPYSDGMEFFQDTSLVDKTIKRFKKDNPGLSPDDNVYELVNYTDFQESYEMILRNKELISDSITEELKKDCNILQNITSIRNRVMHTRPLEAEDFITVYTFTQNVSPNTLIWRNLLDVKYKLEQNPSFVLTLDLPQIEEECSNVFHNLPLPDFDETGFIGRKSDIHNIKKLLITGQKVISIIGDGGVGKSALALKVVYDMLDLKDKCPYEMILWISAKSTILTPKGIEEIKDAITSSSSFIKDLSNTVNNTKDSLEENIKTILEFLKEFKVLLVIDNLETIIDQKILEFIREAQLYCQIVITSRIGLGELEYKCTLSGLAPKEASYMIKEMARMRNNSLLKSLGDLQMNDIVNKLYCNPLSIKWFVNSIEIGKPLEEILQNKKDLLSYCLSNVYDKLSNDACLIISVLLAKRKSKINLPELSYFTELEPLSLKQAINELSKTTILVQEYSTNTGNSETLYGLSAFAQDYLLKHHSPNRQFLKRIDKKSLNLTNNESEIERIKNYNKYRIEAIEITNQTEKVVARFLYEAIVYSRKKDFDKAQEKIEFAKNTAVQYPEVYIISASINLSKYDILNAELDYEKALEIAPENHRLLFFYSNFLMIQKNDSKTAFNYIKKLYQLDNSIEPKILYLRCDGYNGNYKGALDTFYLLLDTKAHTLNKKNLAIIMNTILNFSLRMASDKNSIEKDSNAANEIVFKALKYFSNYVEPTNSDKKLINEFAKLLSFTLNCLSKHLSEHIELLDKILNKYRNLLIQTKLCKTIITHINQYTGIDTSFYSSFISDNENQLIGRIVNYDKTKGFGFIESNNVIDKHIFFHKSSVLNLTSNDELKRDKLLTFELGKSKQGDCAINIILVADNEECCTL